MHLGACNIVSGPFYRPPRHADLKDAPSRPTSGARSRLCGSPGTGVLRPVSGRARHRVLPDLAQITELAQGMPDTGHAYRRRVVSTAKPAHLDAHSTSFRKLPRCSSPLKSTSHPQCRSSSKSTTSGSSVSQLGGDNVDERITWNSLAGDSIDERFSWNSCGGDSIGDRFSWNSRGADSICERLSWNSQSGLSETAISWEEFDDGDDISRRNEKSGKLPASVDMARPATSAVLGTEARPPSQPNAADLSLPVLDTSSSPPVARLGTDELLHPLVGVSTQNMRRCATAAGVVGLHRRRIPKTLLDVLDEPEAQLEKRRMSDASKKILLARRFIRRASAASIKANEEQNLQRVCDLGLDEDLVLKAALRELGSDESDDGNNTEHQFGRLSCDDHSAREVSSRRIVRRLSEKNGMAAFERLGFESEQLRGA